MVYHRITASKKYPIQITWNCLKCGMSNTYNRTLSFSVQKVYTGNDIDLMKEKTSLLLRDKTLKEIEKLSLGKYNSLGFMLNAKCCNCGHREPWSIVPLEKSLILLSLLFIISLVIFGYTRLVFCAYLISVSVIIVLFSLLRRKTKKLPNANKPKIRFDYFPL